MGVISTIGMSRTAMIMFITSVIDIIIIMTITNGIATVMLSLVIAISFSITISMHQCYHG